MILVLFGVESFRVGCLHFLWLNLLYVRFYFNLTSLLFWHHDNVDYDKQVNHLMFKQHCDYVLLLWWCSICLVLWCRLMDAPAVTTNEFTNIYTFYIQQIPFIRTTLRHVFLVYITDYKVLFYQNYNNRLHYWWIIETPSISQILKNH